MPINNQVDPEEAALIVDTFYQAYKRGEGGLKHIPGLLLRIINEGLWQRRKIKTGDIVEFEDFTAFVTTTPPEGLGENVETLKNLCRDHEEARRALDRVTSEELGEYGANQYTKQNQKNEYGGYDITSTLKQRGESSDYLLSRLKRDAPEIFEQYTQGQFKSVRQAAIAAGIVKQQSPYEKAVKTMQKLDSEQDLMELRHEIDCRLDELKQ